jgi:hypothetical protein
MVKNFKYLIEIVNEPDITQTFKLFKTKKEICTEFNIPEYIVDKLLKINNDSCYTTKRGMHAIYQEIKKNVKIYLLRPKSKF